MLRTRLISVGFIGACVFAMGLWAGPAPAQQAQRAQAAEIAFWQSVRDSGNPCELEAYLAAYPRGVFAPLASIRLRALRNAGARKKALPAQPRAASPRPPATAKAPTYRFGEPGWIGVNVSNASLTGEARLVAGQAFGVKINSTTSHGTAAHGGLHINDIVIAIAGKAQSSVDSLVKDVGARTPGSSAKFTILRDDELIDMTIMIGGRFTDNLAAAEAGDPTAQVMIGWSYAQGSVVEKDEAKARQWYAKAAGRGNRDADNNLGNIYWYGRGVAEDKKRAVDHYLIAAELGHSGAQTHMGFAHANGIGARRDDIQAVEWYRKAAAQNDPFGLNNLANMYETGRGGLPKSRSQAISYYRKAAGLGNTLAISNLIKLSAAPYDLAEIQRDLAELGYQPGPVDGRMGRRTRIAIKAFQAEAGLTADGKASLDLLARLRTARGTVARPVLGARADRDRIPKNAASDNKRPEIAADTSSRDDLKDLDALD
jgi:TPR repeat protein